MKLVKEHTDNWGNRPCETCNETLSNPSCRNDTCGVLLQWIKEQRKEITLDPAKTYIIKDGKCYEVPAHDNIRVDHLPEVK